MAEKKNQTQATFSQVVFRGKPKVVRAFLAGLTMGTGKDFKIFYSFSDGVHHEGKIEKLAEMVGIQADEVYTIVDKYMGALIKKLARDIATKTGLKITSQRSIRSASLAFSYHAYGSKYDADLVALLENLPTGLVLKNFKHKVVEDPKAKGVEAYTVAHDFAATASGSVTGPIDTLIAFKRTLKDYPLIESDDIVLKLA